MLNVKTDFTEIGYNGPVMHPCEHYIELMGSIKSKEFLVQLRDYQLL
jgi:hypothetical protein